MPSPLLLLPELTRQQHFLNEIDICVELLQFSSKFPLGALTQALFLLPVEETSFKSRLHQNL